MERFYFLIMGVGIFLYILYWVYKNDGRERISDQTGFLAMRPPEDANQSKGGKRTRKAANRRKKTSPASGRL